MNQPPVPACFFFVNDTATTEIYTLSLHDALPIWSRGHWRDPRSRYRATGAVAPARDRKSTRLNQSPCNLVCRLLLEKKKNDTTVSTWRPRSAKSSHRRTSPRALL